MARKRKAAGSGGDAAPNGEQRRRERQAAFGAVWEAFVTAQAPPPVAYGQPCVRSADGCNSPLGLWVGDGYDPEFEAHDIDYLLTSRRTVPLAELARRLGNDFIAAAEGAFRRSVAEAFLEATGASLPNAAQYLNFAVRWAARLGGFHGRFERSLRALATQFDLSVAGDPVARAA